MFWDAHCHLSDSRVFGSLDPILKRAQDSGITGFVLGGTDPSEWERQKLLRSQYPQFGWKLSFGLHPWWVSSQTLDSLNQALSQLERELPEADAAGELGLDYGPKLSPDAREIQVLAFRRQLELARKFDRPLILHVVGAHREVLDILKGDPPPPLRTLIHSYSGSQEQVREYLALDCLLSISGAITRSRHQRLRQAALSIPLDRLVLETDCPDQPIEGQTQSEPAHLLEVASTLGKLRGENADAILRASSANLRHFFRV
jgi:TatD DNase family protein